MVSLKLYRKGPPNASNTKYFIHIYLKESELSSEEMEKTIKENKMRRDCGQEFVDIFKNLTNDQTNKIGQEVNHYKGTQKTLIKIINGILGR